jgi:hypothetical protein
MNMNRSIHLTCLSGFALHTFAALLSAGNLTPPPGPVAPTMKPLNEVEPRTAVTSANLSGGASSVFEIDQPGSYYLVANLNVPAGKHGIYLHGNGITLDLNGFAVIGASGSLSGVTTADGGWHHDITVKNGSVESCGDAGVDLFGGLSCHVSDVTTFDNGGKGIAVTEALVEHCTSFQNDIGFYDDGGASFIDCISSENTTGFSVTECPITFRPRYAGVRSLSFSDVAAFWHSLLGVEYVQSQQFAEARNSFEEAVRLMPHESVNHSNLGVSLAVAGDWNSAEQEARKALELDPDNSSAKSLLDLAMSRKPRTEKRNP